MYRRNRKEGEVALYVENSFNYKAVENMSTTIDNVFECKSMYGGKKR